MTLGTKLRQLRQNKNWSQQEVAHRLDISQPAYNKWETDQAKPNSNNLLRISEIFETDVYDLLDNTNNDFSNSKFEGTNIIANTNPTINVQSPELIQTVIDNQTKITQLIESQNKLIEKLINK